MRQSLLFLALSLAGRGQGEGERRAIRVAALICCFLIFSGFTYQIAVPGRQISLPADHYAHPDFKVEWWYYTGHLTTESGRRYGYQVTFFRYGLRDRQNDTKKPPLFTDLYMAHFALSDLHEKKFSFRERMNRGYDDRAGAATDRYVVWNEDWKVQGDEKQHSIQVNDRGTRLALQLTPLKPAALHGDNGFSRKGEGEGKASYYYSLPRMKTEGELTIGGLTEKVAGLSWMDHEFGSSQMREDQVGWDWFSIQLDSQSELMIYHMRREDGSPDPYSSGTWIYEDGTTKHLALEDFQIEVLDRWKSPNSGATYPMKWKVTIPSKQLELNIVPEFPDQELITNRSTRVTYWEGAVQINGTAGKQPVVGRGYVEMTGYAARLNF
jgi:predicted secreted hydrolase